MKRKISINQDAELGQNSNENAVTPLQSDCWIYRIVVGALALTLVSSLSGAVWLQSKDKEIPEILIGLGTGALGGLAGLLAPTSAKD